MQTVVIPKREYHNLVERQIKIEKELRAVREIVRHEMTEDRIRPEVLARWEKISRDLDQGKGHTFSSVSRMRTWLKNL